ncbi:MAG TPA: hypothetical protein VN323_24805 [Candidatus Dormibacteraeota bacterium]|nr:hypothetical protein [Candidatus Dormibacteraeota bacterium]
MTRGYVPLEGEAVAASRGEVTPGDLKYPVTTSGEHLRRQFVRTQTAAY